MTASLPVRLDGGAFAVSTHALTKQFGHEFSLLGVDLQVPEGAVYVLVGPNGAGKTTTMRLLLGLLSPDSGRAEVLGLDPRAQGPLVRAQVGYVPERGDWGYGYMTAGRLLEHHAAYFPAWDWEYATRLVHAFEIPLQKRMSKLSKGLARRVHLLMALAHRPPLLLLDEPTDGLDPVMRDETLGMLAEHVAETGCTVFISTHLVHEVDRLADHLGVMRDGRLTAQLPREVLHRMLRRYRADIPAGWTGAPALNGTVVKRGGVGREIQWSIWGEEREVAQQLAESGATLRDAAPLTLEDAAVALLSRKE
ncbi:ABC transporter ATP-binding protein [Longimicrobium sp.]|uniref:ABC transporter ATP-binding protein n=1 Tax=Longimicrobium sp. TaxID=2029185 RepID=UPI002C65710F|nr:ABC transporter ATP-binding protein [Longimicrobium sp.]HSU16516.1 ABC transporter ATP-binding protein [Longimicrobium sp.]